MLPLPLACQVEDLARLSFKRKPLYVGIDDSKAVATREGLEQGYCVVPADKRFLLLFTFLKKNASKKARRPPPILPVWRLGSLLLFLVLMHAPMTSHAAPRAGDGVLQQLQQRQVPQRAAELH